MILNVFLPKNERGAKQDLTSIKIRTITWAAAQVDMLKGSISRHQMVFTSESITFFFSNISKELLEVQ